MGDQLSNFFDKIFHPLLSEFWSGYSCQSVLVAITEHWCMALDRNEYVAAILMDLSKAFDCLPPLLIRDKLLAYGVDQNATNLISNYLSNRKQCVQIGDTRSIF